MNDTSHGRDRFAGFAHLNAERSALYRAILRGFTAAKARFVLHLRPDDVVAALERFAAQQIAAHRSFWRRDVREAGAERCLLRQTLERLEALGLLRRTADGAVALPAIGRFALERGGDAGDESAPRLRQSDAFEERSR